MTPKRLCIGMLAAQLFVVLTNSQSVALPTVDIPYTDRGWYDELGNHDPANLNYLAGDGRGPGCNCPNGDYRNFFVFDLSGVTQPIVSAQLELFVPGPPPSPPGFASVHGSENYELHDVVTPITSLRNASAGLAAHVDLGTGVVFGNRTMTASDMGTIVDVSLNASAIAALNAATGLWAIGGSITTLDNLPNDEYAFGWTNNVSDHTQLRLTLVPEPASGLLWCLALLAGSMRGAGAKRLHRRRRTI